MSHKTIDIPRVHSLDVLRGVAVLLVLIRHLPSTEASAILRFVQSIGWTGVDLFFVLSGFLISGLLFSEFDRTGTLDIRRFWLRRGLKIWPSYFATYGIAMLLTVLATGNFELLISRIPNYIFVQNYMDREIRWTHSWSIAIEEHFYLIFPLVLLTLIPRRLKNLPQIALTTCVLVLIVRMLLFVLHNPSWTIFYYRSHLRIDSLCFGVLLGYLYQYKRDTFLRVGRKFWPCFLIASAAVVLANMFPLETSSLSYTIGFTIFYLVFGGLVVVARAYPEIGKAGPLKVISTIGVYSYTIYLAHSVIDELPGIAHVRLATFAHYGHLGDRLLLFLLSIGLGIAISHAVERPFLKLRAKWLSPSRTSITNHTVLVGVPNAVGSHAIAK